VVRRRDNVQRLVDFWLSEGLATFLADTFLEQRFGKQRYEREIERSRQIVLRTLGDRLLHEVKRCPGILPWVARRRS